MPGFAFYIFRRIISLLCFAFIFVHSCTVVHCRELVSSCDVSIYGGVVTVSGALKMSLSLLVNLISPTLRGRRFAWGAERTEQSDGLGSDSPKISNWDGEDLGFLQSLRKWCWNTTRWQVPGGSGHGVHCSLLHHQGEAFSQEIEANHHQHHHKRAFSQKRLVTERHLDISKCV